MTDYRLDGLSTRTFEHLIQALAMAEISTLVTPFGDGPDGGREATFEGVTNFGSDTQKWDGYGVIQAKFLNSPKSSFRDGQWALKELRKELAEYNKPGTSRRMPEYYIFATNVILTPEQARGSKDKIFALLSDFAARNSLKGFDVWDYDKIRVFLDRDVNEGIRRAYGAWITPGDVLAELAKNLRSVRRDYYKLLVRFLQKELMGDQYARLEQAGNSADEAIPLSQVFIDLPTSREPGSASGLVVQREAKEPFVEYIISMSRNSFMLDPANALHGSGPTPGRYVLIGGPGQGKTTVGQYVCQIFRASLLQDVDQQLLSPEARTTLAAINSNSSEEFDIKRITRRIPFRVVLSEFAASLAADGVTDLLGFLALKFSKRAGINISPTELESLLTQYPCILVLDGLDEVPASTNRDEVLAAVNEFWVDVSTTGIDALVIATSRPQGYNDDFAHSQYSHHYLVPLTPDEALKYGNKLAEVRFGGDPDRLARVCGRLETAVQTPATARLMKSPLQVTIITLLVDRIGQPPEERWALFREYYKLIYQRETERDIPSVRVLKEHSTEVHAIHRRVGLLLQVESEKSGGTEARLTLEQFSNMVTSYLVEEGHEGESLDSLKASIIEAAGNRLVFLVGLELGQVGFEIRSLQEFMAAEGLMEDEDYQVQARLREVAASSNWRNVFLFAAGRVFEERRYLRDTVESICFNMNEDEDDMVSQITLSGSELALDLLEDGPARRQPKKRGSLTRLALQLLDKPGERVAQRLANIYLPETSGIFVQEIWGRLSSSDEISGKNAWQCLALLMEQFQGDSLEKARTVISEHIKSPRVFGFLVALQGVRDEWLAASLLNEFPTQGAISKSRITSIVDSFSLNSSEDVEVYGPWKLSAAPAWLRWFAQFDLDYFTSDRRTQSTYIPLKLNGTTIAQLGVQQTLFMTHSALLTPPADFPDFPPAWKWIKDAGNFVANPSTRKLADLVRVFATDSVAKCFGHRIYDRYPWPLMECIDAVTHGANAESVAEMVLSGKFGLPEDWVAIQMSWREKGIEASDLVTAEPLMTLNGVPFLYDIPIRGLTRLAAVRKRSVAPLYGLYSSIESGPVRRFLGQIIVGDYFPFSRTLTKVPHFDEILFDSYNEEPYFHGLVWEALSQIDLHDARWSQWFETQIPFGALHYFHDQQKDVSRRIMNAFRANPDLEGLLVPLASVWAKDLESSPWLMVHVEESLQSGSIHVRASKVAILLRNGARVSSLERPLSEVLGQLPDLASHYALMLLSRGDSYREEVSELGALCDVAESVGCRAPTVHYQILSNRRRSRLGNRQKWTDLGLPGDLLDVLNDTTSNNE